MNEKSIFETLAQIDMMAKHKKKNNITYLPWSSAWTAVKMKYPKATFEVLKDENHNLYHTDGKTCWVEVEVQIEDEVQTEHLAVMDYKNQAIPLENVTMTNVNNSIKRCLVKCLGLFGLDLNLWEGEELSIAAKEVKVKEAEEEAEKQAELNKIKTKIVNFCTKKIKEGTDKESLYAVIAEFSGDQNPNNIKDIDTALIVYGELQKMNEGKKEG